HGCLTGWFGLGGRADGVCRNAFSPTILVFPDANGPRIAVGLMIMIRIGGGCDLLGHIMATFDTLELRLVVALLEEPRAQIGDLAASLGVARNTVQSRLKRLDRAGILRAGGREVDLAALGYDVLAFITIEVSHRELDAVIAALRQQEQVLEVH